MNDQNLSREEWNQRLPDGDPEARVAFSGWLSITPGSGFRLALAAALGGWLVAGSHDALRSEPDTVVYATQVGESTIVPLHDGSTVHLNTKSRVEVSYSLRRRTLRLLDGEAMFTVAHDEQRPFRVHVDGALVEAVGTQFNIYRREDETTVSVTEGRVKVRTAPAPDRRLGGRTVDLQAGHEATITWRGRTQSMETHEHSPDELARRKSWIDGQLVIVGETLDDVVEQINRYHHRKLVIADRSLQDIRMGGTFEPRDLESFLKILEALHKIKARNVGSGETGTVELYREK